MCLAYRRDGNADATKCADASVSDAADDAVISNSAAAAAAAAAGAIEGFTSPR